MSAASSPDEGKFHVLFVCTGNTCRSPMAEGVLRKLIDGLRLDAAIVVSSAGTMGLTGMPATELAIDVAGDYDVDLTKHRSQALTRPLLDRADLVLAMSAEHYETCRKWGKESDRLYLLRPYPRPSADPLADSIPDPIGGDRQQYERVFLEIDEAIRRGLPEILRRAGIAPSPSE